MLALDEFILWVNAGKPYKTAKEYVEAAKAANGTFKMAGTGSKQEDQIITEAIQKATGAKFIYIPERGGGAVAVQLVGNHVDARRSTIRSRRWRSGAAVCCVRSACSIPSHSTTRTRSPVTWRGPTSRPARRRASTSTT